VTVATYLVQVWDGGDAVQRAIGLIPARVSDSASVWSVGGGQLVPAWLTLVTYMFPHMGWWHVSLNTIGLWMLGQVAEPVMGTRRFVFAYVASGVVCGLAVVLLGPHWTKPAAGASGAIGGVFGAFLSLRLPVWPALDRRNLVALSIESACLIGVAAWLLLPTTPPKPDRPSALMFHLIPILVG
jgi:membrane associated rhomboid family serine protease